MLIQAYRRYRAVDIMNTDYLRKVRVLMSGSALSLSCYVIRRIVITSPMLIRFYWLDQVQVAGWLSDLQIRWSDKRLDVVRCDMAKVGESEWVSVTLSELPAHPARPAAHPPPPSSHSLPDIISTLRGHLWTLTDTWLDAARTCQYSRLYTDSDLSCITLVLVQFNTSSS